MRQAASRLACVACASAVLALGAGSASAAAGIHSPLPGYPQVRGVILVRGSTPGIKARAKAIRTALQDAASGPAPNCELGEDPGRNLCWHGGPVVREHTVHVIFWEGPTPRPPEVEPFLPAYRQKIATYFEDVAHDSGSASSVYAVGAQYGDASGETGLYDVHFNPAVDVFYDTASALPPAGGEGEARCTDAAPAIASVCVTDADMHAEIERAIAAQGWTPSMRDVFFVFTPPRVGGCVGPGSSSAGVLCAFSNTGSGYCAYHNNFANEGGPVLYAAMPDSSGVEGCDSLQHPNGAGGVDGTLDATSHEHEEMITDPTGESWYDAIGQEEADKCVPPEPYEPLEAYGPPLGGSPGAQTAFNQLIDGHEYWLQTEWSNAAGEFQGGCVQRMVNVAFLPPTGAQASVPARFDGSASGAEGDQIVYWEWDFGDEAASGEFFSISAGPIASHTYALPGTYRVALTAVDALGNRNTTSRMVTVGQAPIPPSPPPVSPPPSTSTVTVATPTPAPIRLSATAVGAKLGLPRAGSQLAGLGTIALGHAACPPACGVTLGLYTTVLSTLHGHSISKQVRIGSLHTVIALGGAGTLALKLNAAGRALLRHAHRLRTILKVTVEDQQGATWQLSRPLTLTSPAHAARRRAR